MQQGLGWLRWSVDQFWAATLDELTQAVIGYGETRGVRPEGALPLPEDTIDRLIAMVERAEAEEAEAAAENAR
jgi:hypothetical protein